MAGKKNDLRVAVMRTQLGRARGLGSGHSGLAAWWAERVTSVALIPLTLWFVYSIITLAGAPQATVFLWAESLPHAVLLIALIVTTFHHMQLGLQVVIEDYIHGELARLGSILAVKFISGLLAVACVLSVLKMVFAT